MPNTAALLRNIRESAISEMNYIAEQFGAINLASGYPDFDPPAELVAAAERALKEGRHQYTSPWGSTRLRQAMAEKQSRFMAMPIDPKTHLTITCGGTEALIASLIALCDPGDKVLIFSPFYESYAIGSLFSGAEAVYVPLHPPDFNFDPGELRQAFRQGVKALVLCNPSNPCGKVFTRQELEVIAKLAQEFDAFVIADEVYEHIVYSPNVHSYIASLPGMFERTVTCGSLSKTYAITGWRLGYATAPGRITSEIRKVHDYLTICAPTPLQEAAATALRFPDDYYRHVQTEYTRRRDIFLGCLEAAGLRYTPPQGAYFVLVDISPLGFASDVEFCHWMAKEIGIAAVPGSSFFHEPVNNLVRFSFAKRDDTLVEAGRRLMKLR
jgi:aminotransferase